MLMSELMEMKSVATSIAESIATILGKQYIIETSIAANAVNEPQWGVEHHRLPHGHWWFLSISNYYTLNTSVAFI